MNSTTEILGRGHEQGSLLFKNWFDSLSGVAERNEASAYVFVMGSFVEILRCFDLPVVFPEINSLQMAVRHVAHDYLNEAEDFGYSPDICGYVKADVAVQLRGGVYRAFKAPELRSLYQSSFRFEPNPLLEPEILTGAEVGLDLFRTNWRGEMNLFWSEVDDRVVDVPLSLEPFLLLTPQNVATSRSQGVEIMADASIGRGWNLTLGYAYTDSTITDNPAVEELVGKAIPEVPEHFGSAELRYHGMSGLVTTLRGRASSATYEDAANLVPLDSHVVFDIYAAYPLTDRFEVFGLVENVFDEQYVADAGVVRRIGSPQQIFAGLRFRHQFRNADSSTN